MVTPSEHPAPIPDDIPGEFCAWQLAPFPCLDVLEALGALRQLVQHALNWNDLVPHYAASG